MQAPERAWVGGFLDHLLATWRQQADTPNGLFYPFLDRQWQRKPDGPRTVVSQCRLSYTYLRAFERGGDPAYAQLAQRGLEALIWYFPQAEGGGWTWACHGDGSVADDTDDAYAHASTIRLHAARVAQGHSVAPLTPWSRLAVVAVDVTA